MMARMALWTWLSPGHGQGLDGSNGSSICSFVDGGCCDDGNGGDSVLFVSRVDLLLRS